MEVEDFVIEDDRVSGVRFATSSAATIRTRGGVVINAAGPWVDAVRLLSEPGDKPRLRLTKGIHLCRARRAHAGSRASWS